MTQDKSPIGGQEITRKQLLRDLPHPKTWKRFSARVYAKFRVRPQNARNEKASHRVRAKVIETLRRPLGLLPAPALATSKAERKRAEKRNYKMKPSKKKDIAARKRSPSRRKSSKQSPSS